MNGRNGVIMPITRKCRAVANYIIEEINKFNESKSLREQVMISGRRLQKLLYFCNIEYMKIHNGETLFEDYFYAWPTGPVVPGIYYVFVPISIGKYIPMIYEGEKLELTSKEKTIIDKVLKQTHELDSRDLINITNINGGPWQQLYNEQDPEHNQIIPKEEIYNFYLNKEITTELQKENVSTLVKKLTPPKNIANKLGE